MDFYPPGYKGKGWAPEQIPEANLKQLARKERYASKKAQKYYLPVALAEGRWGENDNTSYGMNATDAVTSGGNRMAMYSGANPAPGGYLLGGQTYDSAESAYAANLSQKIDEGGLARYNGVGEASRAYANKVEGYKDALNSPENKPLKDFYDQEKQNADKEHRGCSDGCCTCKKK